MPEVMTTRRAETGSGFGAFERYLPVWVALCMVVGIGLGTLLPSVVAVLRGIELGMGA